MTGLDKAKKTWTTDSAHIVLSLRLGPVWAQGSFYLEKYYFSTPQDALTDETAKYNWEHYGNPDGPQAMQFGIGLPAWICDLVVNLRGIL